MYQLSCKSQGIIFNFGFDSFGKELMSDGLISVSW